MDLLSRPGVLGTEKKRKRQATLHLEQTTPRVVVFLLYHAPIRRFYYLRNTTEKAKPTHGKRLPSRSCTLSNPPPTHTHTITDTTTITPVVQYITQRRDNSWHYINRHCSSITPSLRNFLLFLITHVVVCWTPNFVVTTFII